MVKRIVIAGSRKFNNYKIVKDYIDFCIINIRKEYDLIFISGGCRGADALGERYALENGYKIERFLPNWEKHGKAAGPRRNKEMAEKSDFVICFWDGKSKGTKSMIEFARQYNKTIRIKFIC